MELYLHFLISLRSMHRDFSFTYFFSLMANFGILTRILVLKYTVTESSPMYRKHPRLPRAVTFPPLIHAFGLHVVDSYNKMTKFD
jgi:hypothetical protein